jgi:hypothetical protein
VAACLQPGMSLSAVSLANGLNPNMVRKWVIDADGVTAGSAVATAAVTATGPVGAHWTTFRLFEEVGMSRRRVVHGGGRSAPATNRPAAAVGNPCSVRQCWPAKFLTRHTRCADVSFRLPCPRGDCPSGWPLDGPHETRSPRGAGRPRRATGCSAKVCSQERRSVSDPPGLPTRQVIPQLAGVCP